MSATGAGRVVVGVAASAALAYGVYRLAKYHILGRWEWVTVGKVTALHVYPIKSCMGTSLESVVLDDYGASGDRRFLIVDESNRFITQRQEAEMALIKPSIDPFSQMLTLEAPGMPPCKVPPTKDGFRYSVGFWDDTLLAVDQGIEAEEWISSYLKRPCRLMGMASDFERPTSPKYSPEGGINKAAFNDGFPLLIATEASLADLNTRLQQPLPMNRFRPNIVVGGDGVKPWDEDNWKQVRISGSHMALCKPCSRCKITTTDQETCERGEEPLETLSKFRAKRHIKTTAGSAADVFFGMNACHFAAGGSLTVGDVVEAKVWVW